MHAPARQLPLVSLALSMVKPFSTYGVTLAAPKVSVTAILGCATSAMPDASNTARNFSRSRLASYLSSERHASHNAQHLSSVNWNYCAAAEYRSCFQIL